MRKIRWGVLGAAKIALETVIPAMQQGEVTSVDALASRSLERARIAADRLGIKKAFGSYEDLLADPLIDAVYIPLPNHLHVPWAIRALEAGKHVLCEKPLGLNASDAQRLLDAAAAHPHLKVMEAFMFRHHPQWMAIRGKIKDGSIGDLRTIHSAFSYFNPDPANIRNNPEYGGGALLDIGCYCISLARFLFDDEPRRVFGSVERDPAYGVDRLTSGILEFDRGTSTFTCATQLAPDQHASVFGTAGRIEIDRPFNPPYRQATGIHLATEEASQDLMTAAANQYTIQGDLFSRAIRQDAPLPTPLGDAIANLHVIDAIVESSRTGGWVDLS